MAGPLDIIEGRRFSCTQCGNCCIKDGLVYVTEQEIVAMAAHLDIEVHTFWENYGVHYDKRSDQPVLEAKDGRGCPLLTPERQCSVHPVKPLQCRSFPFWEDLIADKDEWAHAREDCPGMDIKDGRLYSRAEILKIRDEGFGTDSSKPIA